MLRKDEEGPKLGSVFPHQTRGVQIKRYICLIAPLCNVQDSECEKMVQEAFTFHDAIDIGNEEMKGGKNAHTQKPTLPCPLSHV